MILYKLTMIMKLSIHFVWWHILWSQMESSGKYRVTMTDWIYMYVKITSNNILISVTWQLVPVGQYFELCDRTISPHRSYILYGSSQLQQRSEGPVIRKINSFRNCIKLGGGNVDKESRDRSRKCSLMGSRMTESTPVRSC